MKRTGRQKDIVTPEKKQEQRELLRLFSANIRKILKNTDLLADDLQEIRLRTGAPLLVVAKDQEYFLTPDGALTGEWEKGYPVSPTDIRDTMDYIGSFSLYAYEDELRQGFLTVEGGHRIGIAGKTVIEGEKVKGISHISCINVRVAHEKKGCADRVMPYRWEDGRFLHTLIVSAPGCGKTTMLRDIIRQISDGESPYPGLTVGVVDERSEIAGCYLGVAQNDVGIRTDVLDCCPKAEGMMMLIRAMSPDVVAVDEIGTGEDIRAIESVVNCGCKLLATVHGNSMEDMKQKPFTRSNMYWSSKDIAERSVDELYNVVRLLEQNRFEKYPLRSIMVDMHVTSERKTAQLLDASASPIIVSPGDTITNVSYNTNFVNVELIIVMFKLLLDQGANFFRFNAQWFHLF